jgi:hypothetical protein
LSEYNAPVLALLVEILAGAAVRLIGSEQRVQNSVGAGLGAGHAVPAMKNVVNQRFTFDI